MVEQTEESKSKVDSRKDEDGEEGGMKQDSEDDGEADEVEPKNDCSQGASGESKATEPTTAKKKITNWPMRDIKEPSPNDVLFGRGGGTNHHPGNKRYRKMVEDRKLDYVNCKRLDKPLVALDIIRTWRGQDPPGRFLKLDEKTGLWQDVGDKKAREKTSQALREKAPLIRKQQEEELKAKDKGDSGEKSDSQDDEPQQEPATKTTRFAEGTNEEKKGVKKAVLARDHSLGREYIQVGEAVSLDGFSWQEPIVSDERITSHGSVPPPPPSHSFPSGRNGSHGSIGVPPPDFRMQSHGSIGGLSPPPPPDFYGRMSSGDYLRTYSSSHFESWGPVSSFGSVTMPPQPPPPPQPGYPIHGSWTQHDACMSREHSLSGNLLQDASVNHPALPSAFDSRNGSGYWGEAPVPSHGPHCPPPPPYHGPPPNHYSPREGPPSFRHGHGSYSHSPPVGPCYRPSNRPSPPSPPYDLDPVIAKTWSGGQEIKTSSSFESYKRSQHESSSPPPVHVGYEETIDESGLPRPFIVKRATSNQNETMETKKDLKGPSVKRAALNRDNSLASNRLKEKYIPGYQERKEKGTFDPDKEMNILSDNLEQSTLNTGAPQPKPKPLRPEERISTLDHIAMDLMTRPVPLTDSSRSSTIEALALEFADDPVLDRVALERSSTSDTFTSVLKEGLPRPSCLTSESRMSTMDFLQIINEPLGEEVDDYSRSL